MKNIHRLKSKFQAIFAGVFLTGLCLLGGNYQLIAQSGKKPLSLPPEKKEITIFIPKRSISGFNEQIKAYLYSATFTKPKSIETLSGHCSADTVILTNQDEIDNFSTDFPGCHTFKNIFIKGKNSAPAITNLDGLAQVQEVTEKLLIDSTGITTLEGLASLKKVGINFEVTNNPNLEETGLTALESLGIIFFSNLPKLATLQGLTNNFTNNGTFTLIINSTGLTNLEGLEGIHTVPNMYITGNHELLSLQGLENLTQSGGGIILSANTKLTDISALAGITELPFGPLELLYNYALTDLTGLENIKQIKKHLWIEWNIELETLEILNDDLLIEDEDDAKLKIKDNWKLAFCSEPAICNFLANGGGYEINNNGNGCQSIAQIEASCNAGCIGGDDIVFTGDDNEDWDNPANWDLNRVPQSCDRVEIPAGLKVFLQDNVSIGSLTANGADIEGEGFSLHIKNAANLHETNFYNVNTIHIGGIDIVQITRCNIDGNLKINNASKSVVLEHNNLYESNTGSGELVIKDNPARDGTIQLEGNYISGDFQLNINTSNPDAHTLVSEKDDNEIRGSAFINARNRGGEFRLGKLFQGYFRVRKNLELDAEATDYPILAKVSFIGDEHSEIMKTGIAELEFEEIFFEKDDKNLNTFFTTNITVTDRANFYTGLAMPQNGSKLIFERNAFVSAYSSDSWVNGKVVKMGNAPFTFPVGTNTHQGVIGIEADGANDDVAFEANYLFVNPSSNGYDINQREPGLPKVSNNEYWELKQISGTPVANRKVMLRYDSNYSQETNTYFDLRVAAWDGAKWVNKGVRKLEGDNGAAYATSEAFTTNESIFTLGYIPSRLPVVTVGNLPDSICRGVGFAVQVNLDTVMVGGNTFQVQLSQPDGSFTSFYVIGQKNEVTNSTEIVAFIPGNLPVGSGYKIRVVGTSPALTSTNIHSLHLITIPQQAITVIGPDKVCLNSGIAKYYIQTPEPGAQYSWSVNSAFGSFTTNRDTIYVIWNSVGNNRILNVTAVNKCGNGPFAQKTGIQVVNPAPSGAPVLTNVGRWIQASQHTPPQPGIGIRWYSNGSLIGTATEYRYYAGLAGNYTARYFTDCAEEAVSNTITFAANALPQTITFENIPDKTIGDAPFQVLATASSGLPVNLSLLNGPGNLTSGVYTITNTGTVTIRASQPGDNQYDTAAFVTRTFEVKKANQSINFTLQPELLYPVPQFVLKGNTNSGLPVTYTINNGNANIFGGNVLSINAPGLVSITANQAGNANFQPAPSVTQTTCVRVNELTHISGTPFVCPGQTTTYSINQISGLTYSWRLSNGTTFPATGNTLNITWNTPGTYTLIVSAQANCGAPTANDSLVVQVASAITPGAPANLLPANNSSGLALPLLLSWTAGTNALNYDLFIWEDGTTKPNTPFASNITAFGFTVPVNSLVYNKTYNWQVVSKNACLQTESSTQKFTLRPLPDLMVTQFNIPATANSGQTVSINWTVKNNGPGNTTTNQSWTDAVFLSFDTFPNFTRPPQVQSGNWDQGEFPLRPLLLATRTNVSALDAGQQYSNSVDFTIPINFAGKYYAYVITNYPASGNDLQQMTRSNDTLRAPHALAVTASPTPDLRVDQVVVPSLTFSGSNVSVNYRVKNYGVTIPLPGRWTDKIYISPSPLFNINNAILLKQPKANDTYYPDAKDASFDTTKQLAQDAYIDIQAEVVFPNFIQGIWFVHVLTNATQSIYEGPLANNNINNSSIQILLTPTPGFIVNNLNVPFRIASITQPLSISYNVLNTGFHDNLQRNKGHYYVPSTCAGGIGFRDSLGHGGSSWQDLVFLSNNPNGLVPSQARLLGTISHNGLGASPEELQPAFCPTNIKPTNWNTTNVVRPGSVHPQTFNFNMPNDVLPGTYYLYIHANHNKHVFEFPDTPVVSRSEPIVVGRPDLAISQFTVPANAVGGTEMTLTYTVRNNGTGGIFNASRSDLLFVSNSPTFDATATYLNTLSINTTLAPNAESSHSIRHTFAEGTSGMRYFHLIINYDSTFRETNYGNNRNSAGTSVSNATPADLMVTNIQLPDTLRAYKTNRIRYTITNNGPGTTNGTWTDNIYFSCSPTFSESTAYLVQARTQIRNLPPGASVADSFSLAPEAAYLYNMCFGTNDETNVYVYVKTNVNNGIFEGSHTNNNVGSSGLRRINNTHVDHIVTQVIGADTTTVGRSYPVNWQVQNIGLVPSDGNWSSRYIGWNDAIYFSTDSVLNANAVFAGWKTVANRLNNGQVYNEQMNVTVPKLSTGQYYVHVFTGVQDGIRGEIIRSNNSNLLRQSDGKAKLIDVEQLPLPDLVNVIEDAPTISATGQPVKVKYKVTNQGVGPSFPGNWVDNIWLSTDLISNNGNDILLGSRMRSNGLSVNQNYMDSITATIPLNQATGNYIIIVHTDGPNAVIEQSDTNNLAFAPIAIFTPPGSDLIVENIGHPDTAWLGYPLNTVNWIVRNISANAANGVSSDGIYLSATGEADATAILQGVLNKSINLPPMAGQLSGMAPLVTGVTEGRYKVLVRTDLLNNIPETEKSNNVGQSAKSIFIGVKPLVLNIPENISLHKVDRYYKLHIPDGLIGSTILVTLKTPDSLTLKNEMYAAGGYIPTAARFDQRFDIPNSGNQTLVIASANVSDYYILVRSVTPNAPVQNITLTAVKLPFAILTIQSNSGGNGGNVTVRINGSLFVQGMTAKLSKPGTVIEASRIFFVSGGQVFATFPLQGMPLGLYTISLQKTDGSLAELPNSFTIVPPGTGGLLTGGGNNTGPNRPGTEAGCDPGADAGLNVLLLTELIYPAKVFNGQTFPVQVKFTNPTNMDIPAPTRVLYNDLNLKMSRNIQTVDNGTFPLVLQLTETGGPPGIIRAGGSGTVTVHSRAPLVRGIVFVTFTIQ